MKRLLARVGTPSGYGQGGGSGTAVCASGKGRATMLGIWPERRKTRSIAETSTGHGAQKASNLTAGERTAARGS